LSVVHAFPTRLAGAAAAVLFTSAALQAAFIAPSPTSLSTTPGGSVALVSGSDLTDSALLLGRNFPTGTITFYLFAPGVTPLGDTNSIYTDTVTVSGHGPYSTSSGTNPGGYLPTQTGTYEWVVNYSGASLNFSSSSSIGSEPETVAGTVTSSVPEPSSFGLLVAALAVLLAWQGHRRIAFRSAAVYQNP
jgi:hypothetical protein